jgi:hypothetical protein
MTPIDQDTDDLGFDAPRFEPIGAAEAEEIRGGLAGAAGTCVAIGFACNSSGGIRGGVCVIVGVVTDRQIRII